MSSEEQFAASCVVLWMIVVLAAFIVVLVFVECVVCTYTHMCVYIIYVYYFLCCFVFLSFVLLSFCQWVSLLVERIRHIFAFFFW